MSGIKERRITAICDFLLECEEGHLFESSDPVPAECPICAEIKAAIEAAREEVLELAYNWIVHPKASMTLGLPPTKLVEIRDYIRQAYQERFHEQG